MASAYELSVATSATGTGAPSLEIAAVTRPAAVTEIEIVNTAATAGSFILGRPGNTPTTGTTQAATLPINRPPSGQASSTVLIVALGQPRSTIPAAGNQHRRLGLPATIGAGALWIWNPKEMILDPTRSRDR